jgi:ribonuclease D
MAVSDGTLVTDDREVQVVAERIRAAGAFTLDLEFVPEGRYVPELALVQVGWAAGAEDGALEVAAIDPLAADPEPVLALVGDAEIETVTHAAQGDLSLLAHRYSIHGRALRDTQIGAAFLGFGDQIGYAPLVERMLGVRLHKGSQFTEWLHRPLTPDQLAYALDDVRYLGAIWEQQRGDLEARGRLDWVLEECTRLADGSAQRPPPEEAYRRVKGWSGLRRRPLGALRELAAWREREALRANRPLSRVLNDRSLLELARSAPASDDGLHSVRGVDAGLVRRHGAELIRAIREGAEDPPEREEARKPLPPRGDVWAAALHGLVRARALGAAVAPRFVGPRHEIEAVARWWLEGDRAEPPPLPLLQGWRRDLVGEAILEWLRGDAALVVDPDSEAGIELEPR